MESDSSSEDETVDHSDDEMFVPPASKVSTNRTTTSPVSTSTSNRSKTRFRSAAHVANQKIGNLSQSGRVDEFTDPSKLIGEHVIRRFKVSENDVDSDSELYEGEIISFKYPYWKVCYFKDGDVEDLNATEVRKYLVEVE